MKGLQRVCYLRDVRQASLRGCQGSPVGKNTLNKKTTKNKMFVTIIKSYNKCIGVGIVNDKPLFKIKQFLQKHFHTRIEIGSYPLTSASKFNKPINTSGNIPQYTSIMSKRTITLISLKSRFSMTPQKPLIEESNTLDIN